MKPVGIFTFVIAAMTVMTGASAPGLSVEVIERDGTLSVREVPFELLAGRGLEARCRNYKGQGDKCTIGDGSCYAESPPLYCTWCGDKLGSRCVRQGQSCPKS